MLHRGLAHDREERFPTVTDFVTALESALGTGGGRPDRHLRLARRVDPELTQPGPRPTPAPGRGRPPA